MQAFKEAGHIKDGFSNTTGIMHCFNVDRKCSSQIRDGKISQRRK
jgi:hypothetical protein